MQGKSTGATTGLSDSTHEQQLSQPQAQPPLHPKINFTFTSKEKGKQPERPTPIPPANLSTKFTIRTNTINTTTHNSSKPATIKLNTNSTNIGSVKNTNPNNLPSDNKDEHADNRQAYAWEDRYRRTWDMVKEDEHGRLVITGDEGQMRRKRIRECLGTVKRGIIRHLYVVIDLSTAMEEKDMLPTRLQAVLTTLDSFILEFFDQNPISQLGFIITRDGLAEKLTELSGNAQEHLRKLHDQPIKTEGEPSLQNALELARMSLNHVPAHGTREVLIISANLTTTDPGDIYETIEQVKNARIRCSVIGLSSEVHLTKMICKETKGRFAILDEYSSNFRELLFSFIAPPPSSADVQGATLIVMGFPDIRRESGSLCICHQSLKQKVFVCPRCQAQVCEVPVDCAVCSLTLVSSPHLARSYHYLFPLSPFVSSQDENTTPKQTDSSQPPPAPVDGAPPKPPPIPLCFGCVAPIDVETMTTCPSCSKHFCADCDVFIHDTLYNCPGCDELMEIGVA